MSPRRTNTPHLAVALSLFVVAAADAQEKPRVAVFAGSSDVSLAEVVRAQAGLSTGYVAVSATETQSLLVSAGDLGLVCEPSDYGCWGRIAALGGIQAVVMPVQDGDTLTMHFVEVATLEVRGPVTRRLEVGREAIAIQDALVELMTPARYVGRIAVDGGPAGAEVVIDGAPAAVLPLTEPLVVKPGRHTVDVKDDAGPLLSTAITVVLGETASITVPPRVVVDAAPAGEGELFLPLAIGGGSALGVGLVGTFALAAVSLGAWWYGCRYTTDDVCALVEGMKERDPGGQFALWTSVNAAAGAGAVVAGVVAIGGLGVLAAAFLVE